MANRLAVCPRRTRCMCGVPQPCCRHRHQNQRARGRQWSLIAVLRVTLPPLQTCRLPQPADVMWSACHLASLTMMAKPRFSVPCLRRQLPVAVPVQAPPPVPQRRPLRRWSPPIQRRSLPPPPPAPAPGEPPPAGFRPPVVVPDTATVASTVHVVALPGHVVPWWAAAPVAAGRRCNELERAVQRLGHGRRTVAPGRWSGCPRCQTRRVTARLAPSAPKIPPRAPCGCHVTCDFVTLCLCASVTLCPTGRERCLRLCKSHPRVINNY